MKKLIAVVTLALAFSISANAQDKKTNTSMAPAEKEKVNNGEKAKKDVMALIEKVSIDESLKNDMYTLMLMKYDELSNPKLTAAQRDEISTRYERKVLGGLNDEQRKQLMSDPALLNRISH
jgi:hypothetical protein